VLLWNALVVGDRKKEWGLTQLFLPSFLPSSGFEFLELLCYDDIHLLVSFHVWDFSILPTISTVSCL
jgi:hypothetical protein